MELIITIIFIITASIFAIIIEQQSKIRRETEKLKLRHKEVERKIYPEYHLYLRVEYKNGKYVIPETEVPEDFRKVIRGNMLQINYDTLDKKTSVNIYYVPTI